MAFELSLNGSDWIFKEFIGEDWDLRNAHLPNSHDQHWWWQGSVPGSVLHDLWTQGLVKDPYFERNTYDLEWVSQRTWLYKKQFRLPPGLNGKRIQLCFEGVDYEAKFFLNGHFLGDHRGMFTPAVFEVENYLHFNDNNLLVVVIQPAPQEQPQVGSTSLVHTHKSRMTYWWDFCPRLVHQGIWDDVNLKISGKVCIEDSYIRSDIAANQETAELTVDFSLDSRISTNVDAELRVIFEGELISQRDLKLEVPQGKQSFRQKIQIDQPSLWYPSGSGQQPIYMLEIFVHVDGEISDRRQTNFGIRYAEFIVNEGAPKGALPYTLIVNGRKTYMKGWNWVPMDVLYGVPREKKLRHLLKLAKEANINVLRVWGGGLIEKEEFYNLCDQLGIFVWQEFSLSSSGIDNRPSSDPAYIEMLTRDAEAIIPRKQNHPSLLLWCGGNELQGDDGVPLDDSYPTLAALKEVVNRLDPDRLWLPTSPSGYVFSNTLENIKKNAPGMHDVHGPWEYQGALGQYELYNQGESLLHSEFGVEGITNKTALDKVIRPENQWPISIKENKYWHHLGAWWVKREDWDRFFGELTDVASYQKATQFTQFDGLRYALEADRRRKFSNSGTFPWQFNEPYPMAACTSAVDYYGFPKPVYYAVKSAYEPVHVSARHRGLLWGQQSEFSAEVWANNSHLSEINDLWLDVRLLSSDGQDVKHQNGRCSLPGNKSIKLFNFVAYLEGLSQVFFLDLKLRDDSGKEFSINRYTFTRAENLGILLQQPGTSLTWNCQKFEDQWQIKIKNTGKHVAMNIWAEYIPHNPGDGYAYFSDNYFCLLPDELKTIDVCWENILQQNRKIWIEGWNTSRFEIY